MVGNQFCLIKIYFKKLLSHNFQMKSLYVLIKKDSSLNRINEYDEDVIYS